MSLGSVLSIARSALNAQQTVMQTAGHNIANVETEGYSRQRTELAANYPQHWTYGSVGTGVIVQNVSRARDALLDTSYRGEASGAASSQLRHDLLESVQNVLGEPSETGLSSAMDAFWSSWSDLATSPTSPAARSVVQQAGQNVASILNSFDARLTDLRAQTLVRVDNAAERINTLADQIASLNSQIVSSEVDGTTASDLRDQRDRAIDELAGLGDVRTTAAAAGSVQVMLGANSIVDGSSARHIKTITTASGQVGLQLEKGTEPMLSVGGSTQTLLDFVNRDLPDMQSRLDALASSLVTQVNAIQTAGVIYPAGGGAPVAAGAFFDPTKVTARDISLSTAVAASATNIAASAATPSGTNVAGPGNNEIALRLAGLRTAANQVTYVTPGGATETGSFADFYRDTASRLGTQVTNAASDAQVHATLASQADARRQSISGVNLDEELTTLMRAQQAYAAAAKVISAADEMMQTLVQMI
jgi:flagellar hook-associated protein 1 FlgK